LKHHINGNSGDKHEQTRDRLSAQVSWLGWSANSLLTWSLHSSNELDMVRSGQK